MGTKYSKDDPYYFNYLRDKVLELHKNLFTTITIRNTSVVQTLYS